MSVADHQNLQDSRYIMLLMGNYMYTNIIGPRLNQKIALAAAEAADAERK